MKSLKLWLQSRDEQKRIVALLDVYRGFGSFILSILPLSLVNMVVRKYCISNDSDLSFSVSGR